MKNYDIVIIGGGPAGMAAALKASENGASVLILERDQELGGILNQCIHDGFGVRYFKEALTGPEFVQRQKDLIENVQLTMDNNAKGSIVVMVDSMVTGIQPPPSPSKSFPKAFRIIKEGEEQYHCITAINDDKGVVKVKAKAVILAMGCRERTRGGINIPGNRPAGVYPAGLAQRLINIEGYMVGKRVVILGSGDIGLIMARRLSLEGAKVLCVAEVQPYLAGLMANKVRCLDDFGIPLYLRHTLKSIHGENRVESVEFAEVAEDWSLIEGTEKKFKCDTVLFAVGLIPENELSTKAGIKLSKNGGAIINERNETNVPGIFSAGNVLQVHDLVDWAVLEGERTAEQAVEYVNQQFEKKSKQSTKVLAGENVGYVKPDIIEYLNADEKVTFSFRVREPMEDVDIRFVSGSRVVFERKKKRIIPSEMENISVSLNREDISEELRVEVVER